MRKGTIVVGAGLLLAIAGGGLLAVHASPQASPAPSVDSKPAFAPVAKPATFASTCNVKEGAADTRPDPAWVGQSFAGDGCVAPSLPARVNGFTASRDRIVAAMAAHKNYDAAATAYQRCLRAFAGKGGKPPTLAVIETHRLVASRASQKKVADQTKLAINQFNAYGSDCPD